VLVRISRSERIEIGVAVLLGSQHPLLADGAGEFLDGAFEPGSTDARRKDSL
jgi:hypothetical protein